MKFSNHFWSALLFFLVAAPLAAQADLAKRLRELDSKVIVVGTVRQQPLASMLARDAEARLRIANQTDRKAWEQVKTKADWERFRDTRIRAMRASLGEFPGPPADLKLRVTKTLQGAGFEIDNVVYQTRPGLLVTANLYRPDQLTLTPRGAPGIVICSSHFGAKDQGTRQDMAMTWARAGCFVLVPDHLGHGERQQHPFGDDDPHDYHFRYDVGIQLHLVGESLMGWFAWDLMRGVDVLLAQKGIDAKRILMISDPAGGGDVAAVTAALDERIAGVMVQNFGGPEPENPYPLARDADESFNFATSGSWESTRNLRLSARDGFLPWTIVAASAPRRLIYDHEFYWDRQQDPVWKRLQKVYGFYNAADSLTGVAGRGFVVGSKPENTHWLAINRELLYPVLERWFNIANPKKEYSMRRPADELRCLTPEMRKERQPLHALAARIGIERTELARKKRQALGADKGREQLRQDWQRLLGDVAPQGEPMVKGLPFEPERLGDGIVERIQLSPEPGIVLPVLLLRPEKAKGTAPIVLALAQEGKQAFLKYRAEAIAELLQAGNAVCLLDVRGTGETNADDSRDRKSATANIVASEWMLGDSLLAGRLRDVRSILKYLRDRKDLDGQRVALWGESFAPVNAPDRDLKVAHTAANRPTPSEPLGGLLALLTALYEPDVKAVYVQRGLSDYQSVLQGSFAYIPHDVVVPGVLMTGDLCNVAAALAPRPLRLEGLVDGVNRTVTDADLGRFYEPARAAYKTVGAAQHLHLGASAGEASVARWLTTQLQGR